MQEYMQGGTLKALLMRDFNASQKGKRGPRRKQAYRRQDLLRWALDIARACHYLHKFHPMIVHRDLKLENILLTATHTAKATAKLADFGLHKMIKVCCPLHTPSIMSLSVQGLGSAWACLHCWLQHCTEVSSYVECTLVRRGGQV